MQWLSVIVPSVVSILGFIISYKSLNSSFIAEIKKQKSELQMDKMSEIPYLVFDLLDYILKKQGNVKVDEKEQNKRFQRIMNTSYAYGSTDTIKVVTAMQEYNYTLSNMTNW